MRTLIILLITTSFCLTKNFAQDTVPDISTVTRVAFLNPGISFETKTGKNQSFHGTAFMTTLSSVSYSSALGWNINFDLNPALALQYRFYYNAKNRQAKGKRTEMNSLNYVSPAFETYYTRSAINEDYLVDDNRHFVNAIGAVWGLQRNYRNRFSLDFNLGLGYLFTREKVFIAGERTSINTSEFTPLGRLSLGFWLNRKK